MKSVGYLLENYHIFHLRDTAGQERDYHYHDFNKIVIHLEGRVDYELEDVSYSLSPGDILLVRRHVIHKAHIDLSLPYERIILYVDTAYSRKLLASLGTDCFELAESTKHQLLTPEGGTKKALASVIEGLKLCREDESPEADILRDSLVSQLMVLLYRCQSSGALATPVKTEAEAVKNKSIAEALTYINNNLSSDLDVGTLSERVFLSRYHFMRLFKEETGETVHSYIRRKRLINAAILIREGEKAAEAAEKSGFTDYSAFHRAFKEEFNTSPGKFK